MHWHAAGENYYGDHLLFERLYGNLQEELDGVAERIIGLLGSEAADPATDAETAAKMTAKLMNGADPKDFAEIAIGAEKALQSLLKDIMKEDTTDGLEDLIQGIASAHETHLYLLQQRSKSAYTGDDKMKKIAAGPLLSNLEKQLSALKSEIAELDEELYKLPDEHPQREFLEGKKSEVTEQLALNAGISILAKIALYNDQKSVDPQEFASKYRDTVRSYGLDVEIDDAFVGQAMAMANAIIQQESRGVEPKEKKERAPKSKPTDKDKLDKLYLKKFKEFRDQFGHLPEDKMPKSLEEMETIMQIYNEEKGSGGGGKRQIGPTIKRKRSSAVVSLYKVAYELDQKGLYSEADEIDKVLKSLIQRVGLNTEDMVSIADYLDQQGDTDLADEFDAKARESLKDK